MGHGRSSSHDVFVRFHIDKLGRLGRVDQFQLIQESRYVYRLRISADASLSDEIAGNIATELKSILGADAQLEIEYTGGIPVLNSGKRKYIASIYNPFEEKILTPLT